MKNYIYGRNAVENVIKNFNEKIKQIFILKGQSFTPEIYSIIKKNNLKWFSLEKNEFIKLIDKNSNHQGLVAEVEEFQYSIMDSINFEKQNGTVLILDQIQDPQNFGSIIRTASLFNVLAIIIKNNNQVQITPSVMKASAGTIYNVPIIKVSNLKSAIKLLKSLGYWIYCSYLNQESKPIEKINFDKKSAIILGNEGKGVENNIAKLADFIFKIETNNVIDSLNVSVATGIILFFVSIEKKGR